MLNIPLFVGALVVAVGFIIVPLLTVVAAVAAIGIECFSEIERVENK